MLGTHDKEAERLALQHRVWRPRVLAAWERAGFAAGQTLVDVGCGVGSATLDLADIVGPRGTVIAIDRSRRFLDILQARSRERGLSNIVVHELDLNRDELPAFEADGIWDRWALGFVARPQALIAQLARRLKPGAPFVLHEYVDYGTWRMAPPCPELDAFVAAVMRAWRADGGEPDLGLWLPDWLAGAGLTVTRTAPFLDMASPGDPLCDWLGAFVASGTQRLAGLGLLSADAVSALARVLDTFAASGTARMMTPAVVEVIATRDT